MSKCDEEIMSHDVVASKPWGLTDSASAHLRCPINKSRCSKEPSMSFKGIVLGRSVVCVVGPSFAISGPY